MKRTLILMALLGPISLLAAQTGSGDDVKALIKQLGSDNFVTRQVATKALSERPDAQAELCAAARSADVETRRRIEGILEIIDRQPLRDLEALAKKGRVDELIRLVAVWPVGKYDAEVWTVMHNLAHTIYKLHVEKGGKEFRIWEGYTGKAPTSMQVIRQAKIDYSMKVDENMPNFFLRAEDLDLVPQLVRKKMRGYTNRFDRDAFPVISGNVRYTSIAPQITYAGKDVTMGSAQLCNTIVISGGDIRIKAIDVIESLFIARGDVIIEINEGSTFLDNHVIAGKKVKYLRNRPNRITEDELNPLGFIRWSDAPKDKGTPKSK